MVSMLDSPIETLADLLRRLGDVDPARVRFHPAPGTATELDLRDVHVREGRLCELVDKTLVEKTMGFRESWLASLLIHALLNFVQPRHLGVVTGEAGMIRLASGLVRIPDVAYIAWERLPNRRLPVEPVPGLVPNLVIEVLSRGNTASEMARKRQEYFAAGVQLVWLISPEDRTVVVYTAVDQPTLLDAHQTLDGGAVLPGFTLSLNELFTNFDRMADDA
jgi:Uma2 family endonuclease